MSDTGIDVPVDGDDVPEPPEGFHQDTPSDFYDELGDAAMLGDDEIG
jgi:hypothetical protein